MAAILLTEDDQAMRRGIAFYLEKNGHMVVSCETYEETLIKTKDKKFDIALIDINLPDESGLTLCKALRKDHPIPVIFITAKDTEEDVVQGFKTGCDDYISKPFSLKILNERINAVLRRMPDYGHSLLELGDIVIDFDNMSIKKSEQLIKLTPTEYKIAELLIKNRGQVLTREIILQRLWDSEGNFVDENALSVNILRLRKKLEDDCKNPLYIKTVFGIGYTWGDPYEI